MYTSYREGSVEGVKSLQVVYRFLSISYQEKENSRFEQAPTISQPPQIGWEIGSFFWTYRLSNTTSQRNARKVFENNTRHPTKVQTPETGKIYDGLGQGERRVGKRKKRLKSAKWHYQEQQKNEDKILEICVLPTT